MTYPSYPCDCSTVYLEFDSKYAPQMFAKSIEVFFPSVTTQISTKPRATRVTVSSKDDDFHGLAVMIFSVQYVHDHPGVKFV